MNYLITSIRSGWIVAMATAMTPLYSNDYATIPGTFHFQENTFLTLEVTTRNTDFGSFGQVEFIGLKV